MACYRITRYYGGGCGGGGRNFYGGGCFRSSPSCGGRYRSCSYESNEGDRVVNYGPGGLRNPMDREIDNDTKVLKLKGINTLIEENTKVHHTDEYSITEAEEETEPDLVIRRGQPFDIELSLNREFDRKTDDLRLILDIGDNPMPSKGTRVDILLSDRDEPKKWGAKIKSLKAYKIVLTIFTPPNCIVGRWSLGIDNHNAEDGKKYRYRHDRKIYIIFNPWCKDDVVYMPSADDREEYVMNEVGKIYVGSKKNISGRVWNFAQFQSFVLECVMNLLEKSTLQPQARGDPIKVVRKLTSLCNSPDNNGILEGNWSGQYQGGSSPLKWTGSHAILKSFYFMETPVKYGQCWVFSGVLTTICRTLGIPARSVTCFASAHDVDASITIDTYYNERGDSIEELNGDSVWNFHVWNESYMARRDLPQGYGGWQVMDSTPQEASEGVFCCGPASRIAIKKGEVAYAYDAPFIFAEVNADRVQWLKNDDGTWTKTFQKNSVGKFISTKRKGDLRGNINSVRGRPDPDREDITNDYKYPEGSEEERVAVLTAQRNNTTDVATHTGGTIYETGPEDVDFEFVDMEDIFLGKSFDIILKATNKSNKNRHITVALKAHALSYAGGQTNDISGSTQEHDIPAGRSHEFQLRVTPDDYVANLLEHGLIDMCAWARVKETNQVFFTHDDFNIIKPELNIACSKQAKVGQDLEVTFSFRNPLNMTLTKCKLLLEGPGIQEGLELDLKNIAPNENFSKKIEVVPKRPSIQNKPRTLAAKFSSLQVDDIDGYVGVRVAPA